MIRRVFSGILTWTRRSLAALFVLGVVAFFLWPDRFLDAAMIFWQGQFGKQADYDLVHLDLEAWFDPDGGTMRGDAVCRIRLHDPAPARFMLALWENLEVEEPVECVYAMTLTRWSHLLTFVPREPLAAGEEFEVRIRYSGPVRGDVSLGGRILNQVAAQFPSYGLRPDGIELNPYSAWYPLPPVPGKFYTWKATIHEPAWSQTICGGIPEGATVEEGQRTTVWRSDGDTVSLSAMGGPTPPVDASLPPRTFHSRQASERFSAATQATVDDIWAFYVDRFGPVPRESRRLVEVARTSGRSYACDEIALRRQWLSARGEPVQPAGWEGLLGHEMAHLYWGILVRQDPLSEGLWFEGLAEYSSILYMAERGGPEALAAEMAAQHYAASHPEESRPLARQYSWSSDSSALLYRRTCSVWRMLHYVLGDEAFLSMLREMVETSGDHTGMDKIRTLAEKHRGASLDWFFDYWWEKDRLPDYSLSGVSWDGRRLSYTVGVDGGAGLHWAVPVRVSGPGGARSVSILPDALGREQAAFPEFTPTRVEIDPEWWILDRNRSNNRVFIDTVGGNGT